MTDIRFHNIQAGSYLRNCQNLTRSRLELNQYAIIPSNFLPILRGGLCEAAAQLPCFASARRGPVCIWSAADVKGTAAGCACCTSHTELEKV